MHAYKQHTAAIQAAIQKPHTKQKLKPNCQWILNISWSSDTYFPCDFTDTTRSRSPRFVILDRRKRLTSRFLTVV